MKEVANMTGVTIKTLHYYHKIGLLLPCRVTDAGYRLYGEKELMRLQQILFYRELDFSLDDIKKALKSESDRVMCLKGQQELLCARKQRIDCLLRTIAKSIHSAMKGEMMPMQDMFQGFDKQGWEKALAAQNEYLKEKYNYNLLEKNEIKPQELNEKAAEAQDFMNTMAAALKNRLPIYDEKVQKAVSAHLAFLHRQGTEMDAKGYLASVKFLSQDDFHRDMLESHQIGLSYYLMAVAEQYAANHV